MKDLFIQIVIILIAARFFAQAVQYLSIPPVIGELIAGIILGPSLLDIVKQESTIQLLAEIGAVMLLFEIGLETQFQNLIRVGSKATYAAIAGIIVPFILGFFICYYFFSQSILLSLFVGGTLTATSIGVTLRVMSDLNRKDAKESQIVLGAAIIDDIIGIVILAMLFEFSQNGSIDLFSSLKIVLFILLFLLLSPLLVKIIASVIKKYESINTIPGLLPTSIVSLILFFSWLAKKFGAPELLGGFAAGIALSKGFFSSLPKAIQIDEPFTKRVELSLKPIIYLFVPIFFVNIGVLLNLKEVSWSSSFIWIFTLSLLVCAIVGKLSSGLVLRKESSLIKLAVGLAMIPRGEVGLVFAEVGKSNNIFNQDVYAALTLVVAITTLIAPIGLKYLYKKYDSLEKKQV
jgi:Kef-type K+ transport system membrane component KefB